MSKKNHLEEKQNKGFTLVEVLIAITILAIIVVPLLRAFVVSSQTNAKAKQLMKATTLAQNVMEELKANSLEEVARQFNGYQSSNSISSLGTAWEATWDTSRLEYVPVTTNASVIEADDPDKNPEGLFVGQDSGKYYFLLEGVQREHAKFDVAIELTRDAENGTKKLTQINAMNQADCGYYAESVNAYQNAVTTFLNANYSYRSNPEYKGSLDSMTIGNKLSRTITIDIASLSGNETVSVRYDYELEEDYAAEEDRYISESIMVFDNYLSDEKLKAVYLYYFPLYEGEDKIQIFNNNNLDLDVYLIKMVRTAGNSSNSNNDSDYLPKVVLSETSKNADKESHAILCSNIVRKGGFEYKVVDGILRTADLGNEKDTDLFYDIKIDVYKHNSSEPSFKASNRITTFTGSKMDNSNKVDR